MMGKKSLEYRNQMYMGVLENLVPNSHLVRDIDKHLDLSYVYEMLKNSYCADNGRKSIDPVVLIKIAIIKKMFGISSLRKTVSECEVNVAYRWYLGYGLDEDIPHFTTYIKNYARVFGSNELFSDLFERILNDLVKSKIVNMNTIFVDSTHIKASANKNKKHKIDTVVLAKEYQDELEEEINEERKKLDKSPLKKKKK